MAGSETSFNSYTFTYKWKVNNLDTQLLNKPVSYKFNSPTFSSPNGAKPATVWMLTLFNNRDADSAQTPPPPVDEQCLSVELKYLASEVTGGVLLSSPGQLISISFQPLARAMKPPPIKKDNVWVEARLKSQSSNFDNLTEFGASSVSQGPTKLCISKPSDIGGPGAITFKHFIPLFKVQDSQSITFECEIKVSSNEPPPPTNFSLNRLMEEARQNNLFTDVTLVADGKEFKAHKVVLASQSQFFKTRFSGRWVSPRADGTNGDRVEMTDVPVVIMEAILSYVYTGKVADIEKIAEQLLPPAEEYGLVGLQKMCEEHLIQSLTTKTVINTLIHASAHNAPYLKKACIEFVVHNTAAVRQSEGWDKLKKDQTHRDLWVELLENIAENH